LSVSVSRVAVVGAGPMGRLHARAVARRSAAEGDCALEWVVDRHLARGLSVSSEFGGRATDGLTECLGHIDTAIVAVPTASHAEVVSVLLEAGIDVLVEKPMTGDVDRASGLVELARARGRVLGVGHVEWFNAGWRAALAQAGVPRVIEVERSSPPVERGLDIDVVQDFMLHDLDWVRRCIGNEIVRVNASGRRVCNEGLDEASAELEFEGGMIARLRASRVDSERRRVVRVEGSEGAVEVDLLVGVDGGTGDAVVQAGREPLDLQWADFLGACRSRLAPENAADTGVETLRLVERVRQLAAGR